MHACVAVHDCSRPFRLHAIPIIKKKKKKSPSVVFICHDWIFVLSIFEKILFYTVVKIQVQELAYLHIQTYTHMHPKMNTCITNSLQLLSQCSVDAILCSITTNKHTYRPKVLLNRALHIPVHNVTFTKSCNPEWRHSRRKECCKHYCAADNFTEQTESNIVLNNKHMKLLSESKNPVQLLHS